MTQVLPSITTLSKTESSWESKCLELVPNHITEVALFLTGVHKIEARRACYQKLESVLRTHPFVIPFVHATSLMEEWEYCYLIDTYNTQWFNLHPLREFALSHPLSTSIREHILVENSGGVGPLVESDLEGFAGFCIDLSHLEDSRRTNQKEYEETLELISRHPVHANHISAVGIEPHERSNHVASKANGFRYLSELDPVAFAPLAAIEVENSLIDQLNYRYFIERAMKDAHEKDTPELAA